MSINWDFFFSFWGMVLGTTVVVSAFLLPIIYGFNRMIEADDFLDFFKGLGITLLPFVVATLFISAYVH